MNSKLSPGINRSENLVYTLFSEVFLPIHVFANTWKKDGKELCDVLVKISDRAIVISVKDRKLDLEQDRLIAWSRWSRRTIEDSIGSLSKAARYIRTNLDEIYLTNARSETLPPWVVEGEIEKIHKVIVGFNVEAVMPDYKSGDEKTLRFQTIAEHDENAPGMVGVVKSENELIHVLDIEALKILLIYTGTPFECLEYLDWRADRLAERNIAYANGEEDLLTEWLAQKHGIWKPLINAKDVAQELGELPAVAYLGIHAQLKESATYQRILAAHQECGFWNDLAAYVAEGALVNHKNGAEYLASAAGLLSIEPKYLRAFAWHKLKELAENNDSDEQIAIIVMSAGDENYAYYFFIQSEQMPDEERVSNAIFLTNALAQKLNKHCLGIGMLSHSLLTKPAIAYAEGKGDYPTNDQELPGITITYRDAYNWYAERFPAV